jgi:hypothetical protein
MNQALQYYMHDGSTAFRFELAGNLNDEGAHKLDQAWRTASSVIGDRRLIVDMTFVTGRRAGAGADRPLASRGCPSDRRLESVARTSRIGPWRASSGPSGRHPFVGPHLEAVP